METAWIDYPFSPSFLTLLTPPFQISYSVKLSLHQALNTTLHVRFQLVTLLSPSGSCLYEAGSRSKAILAASWLAQTSPRLGVLWLVDIMPSSPQPLKNSCW